MTGNAVDRPSVVNPNVVHIWTKVDLGSHASGPVALGDCDLGVSTVTGEGIAGLLDLLKVKANEAAGGAGDVLPTRLRHVQLLQEAASHIAGALRGEKQGLELRSDDLRRAAASVGRISGAVDVEDLLDVIFSQFCIGK
ncbi:hypothetical protein [Mesorhizobium marinum]|uniref:hypothetical protein n=1 Tax=Mesorhizobium marinum TaxID=3228790 RepID=UPI0034671C5B